MTNEAFGRIKIDQLLKDTDWRLTDGISVRCEYPLDAFAEHLPHLSCYRVPRTGRRFQVEKRVTIVTLQTLVNENESDAGKSYFLRVAKRTTGIASVNKTELGGLPVLVPPMRRQATFTEQSHRIESLARHVDAAAAKAEAMAAGLSAEMFGKSPNKGNGNG